MIAGQVDFVGHLITSKGTHAENSEVEKPSSAAVAVT